jgi:N-carbamoylputrescine amidase
LTTIALVQGAAYGDPASLDLDANRAYYLERVERACAELEPALVVLPELFTAPYFCSSHDPVYYELAEPMPGPTTDALADLARRYETYITAPIFECADDGAYYDSCALIGPDGGVCDGRLVGSVEARQRCARKVHLPHVEAFETSIDEKFWFTPGSGFTYFDTGLGRVGILLCYDRSFPEAWRTLVLAGVDLVVVPVTSHGFREALFLAELQTRAAENGVFVAACNRVGPERIDRAVTMFGGSCVVSPLGEVLARGSSTLPEIVSAEVDLADAAAVREAMPYLRDRRPECYRL